MNPRRFFRPGRVARRIMRRQTRRFLRRRARRFLVGGAIVLALSGTHRAYKFRQNDVERLENHYGKPAEELSEDEIVYGMRNLGIQKIELDEQDRAKIYESDNQNEDFGAEGKKYCSNCGDIIDQGEIYCSNCGIKL